MTDNPFNRLGDILESQLKAWPQARKAFQDLENVQTRCLAEGGPVLQYNPARIASTVAKIKPGDIDARPCFLCPQNRPKEQTGTDLGTGFELTVNPFPILKQHFCIISTTHRPQKFSDCCSEMLRIAALLPQGYMIFYNGPRSGASAPDHLHMQLGLTQGVPLAGWLERHALDGVQHTQEHDMPMRTVSPLGFPVNVFVNATAAALGDWLETVPIPRGEYEPRMNVLAMNVGGQVVTAVIRRTHHRPACFYLDDSEGRCMVSHGALDMCGLIITPRLEDFNSITLEQTGTMFSQVTPVPPTVRAGIMSAPKINVTHNADGTFTLHGVTIGSRFHWQRQESQTFGGSLEIIRDGGLEWAVNRIDVEEYLTSVVSSEMKATAPLEFLKAHAVISRSWLLAQMSGGMASDLENDSSKSADSTGSATAQADGGRIIKWYDHDQHTLFDVCADDHCQRYQGLTRIISPQARQAVLATRGQVLLYGGHLCDTRFSKCCGGRTELFESCWQDIHYPYLESVADPYCGQATPSLLEHCMNSYDIETGQFHRWQVRYTQQELSCLFRRKTGLDIGLISDLKPLKAGPSGRIVELQVTGSGGSVTIGKELEIRRALSPTHLLSSAFTVSRVEHGGTLEFVLDGCGWGHGVGLCQTGAAVMATQGFDYIDILKHYYPGSRLGNYL